MQVVTFEGIVEKGRIRLKNNISLPDKTKVYVVIPEYETRPKARVFSPRLVHPEQASDFVKEVIEDPSDAGI